MRIVTESEIKNRIENKWPNEPFEIVEYTKVTKPITIKCLKCGAIKKYASCSNYLGSSRKGVCECYNENSHNTRHNNNKQTILDTIKNTNNVFESFGYRQLSKKYTVKVLCTKCNQVFEKSWQGYLKNSECSYCENKQKLNTQPFSTLISEEYELLSEYENQEKKVLVRHKECGFIWKVRPHNFLNYIGCPKCNKKRSVGEQKVQRYLDSHYIVSDIEVSFDWQSNKKRRYDFYLPEYNLIIEYMGEQHYRSSSLFETKAEEQQKIDEIKRQECLQNGINYLAICYKDFAIVDNILEKAISSTTNLKGVDLSKSKE